MEIDIVILNVEADDAEAMDFYLTLWKKWRSRPDGIRPQRVYDLQFEDPEAYALFWLLTMCRFNDPLVAKFDPQ